MNTAMHIVAALLAIATAHVSAEAVTTEGIKVHPDGIVTLDLTRMGSADKADHMDTHTWTWLPELRRFADSLATEGGWSSAGLLRLRTALVSPTSVVSRVSGETASLAEWLRRDALYLSSSSSSYFSASSVQGDASSDSSFSPLTIAVETGDCGLHSVRRIHFMPHDCTYDNSDSAFNNDPFEDVYHSDNQNSLTRSFSSWANKSSPNSAGFTLCASACRDPVVRISDMWAKTDPLGVPTRLALFSPTPISECSALHLLTVSKFFGIPGPSPSNLDKSYIWNDDRVAIMTADPILKSEGCVANVDAAIKDLPIKDREMMRQADPMSECEDALDGLDWKLFGKVYEEYILKKDDEYPAWPSFARIFSAYIPTFESSNWDTALGSLPCSDWAKWTALHPIASPAHIPILNLDGPSVSTVSDLIHLSLKLSSSRNNVHPQATHIPDSFLADFSTVCDKCRRIQTISMRSIFKAAKDVTPVACRNTLLGGRSERVSEFLTTHRSELERIMLGLSGTTGSTFERTEKATGDELHFQGGSDELGISGSGGGGSGGSGASGSVAEGGVLGSLFGKELSDRGKLLTTSNGDTVLYFDRCPSSARLQFSLPLTLLNLKYSVGRKNLKAVYLRITNNISVPYETSFSSAKESQTTLPSEYIIKSFNRWFEFDGFEESAVLKFSSDGSHLDMDIAFKRDLTGRYLMAVGFNFAKASKMDEFSVPLVCGYSPEVAVGSVPRIQLPHSNPLIDFHFANGDGLGSLSAPTKYHVASFDLQSLSENTPFLMAHLSFLAGQSSFLVLQNSRHLSHNDANPLQLPSAFKSKLVVTDPCDGSVSGASAVSGGRLVYRADLVVVETCLEADVGDIEEAVTMLAPGVEIPVVSVVTSKKDKNQKIIIINVNWQPQNFGTHAYEAKLLLFLMEYFRITLGHPMVVAGQFGDHVGNILKIALEETGTWRTFFAPSSPTVDSFVWAPFVPEIPRSAYHRDASARHAPVAYASPIESCLAPSNSSLVNICDTVKEYAKSFRKAVGGIIAEDRLLAKHTRCANEISNHLPIVYTINQGGEPLTVVSFNLGGLSLSRISRLQKTPLFTYLAEFDIVLLQTTRSAGANLGDEPEEEFDSEKVGVRLTELLTQQLLASSEVKSKLKSHTIGFQHHTKKFFRSRRATRLAGMEGATNLHILYKEIIPKKATIPRRLEMLNCTSEQYGPSSSLLGCLFSVKTSEYFIVATLDDEIYLHTPTTSNGARYNPVTSLIESTGQDRARFIPPVIASSMLSPLSNPDADLPVEQVGVMKQLYNSLCMRRGWNVTETDCSKYPVMAAFTGTWGWGAAFKRDGRKGKLNGTFAEFRATMDGVEKEIIRKNQIGDRKFPTGHNSKLRVRAITPAERVSRDYLKLLFDDEPASGLYGWFSGGQGGAQVQWPYWTDQSGYFSDYAVLWTSRDALASESDDPQHPTSTDSEAEMPSYAAYVDPFLGSPLCTQADALSNPNCRSTAPACANSRIRGVGSRLEAGGRGGVGAAERRGWSLWGDGEGYNGGGRFSGVCKADVGHDEL
ncbi:hypothetical protein HDU80_010174 [Chytriomyces hyalinus]|nr:hypothetical protein HDU80_010174 [Chytriomyces hyalinus]